jgi:S-adenosylmethionine-diacylgycerolhomoserine-N-methlytransferase
MGSKLLSDLSVIRHLLFPATGGDTHAERVESFYTNQAAHYDSFRDRLLMGRTELINEALGGQPNGFTWVDIGAGTGACLDFVPALTRRAGKISLVDLSPSLLKVAKERSTREGYTNVEFCQAEAANTGLIPGSIDVVTFSYSLTMIPNWWEAIDHAVELLRPGGILGVVDFFVSQKFPAAGSTKHSWLTRNLLPVWFEWDGVMLSREHLPFLKSRLQPLKDEQHFNPLPYLPFIKAPYYVFVGQKAINA